MDVARRPLLTEPGEPLLVPQAPLAAAVRWATFQETFGLGAGDVFISSLTALPLPLYPARWPEGRPRWAGARPEAMWHPLMWLPPRLAGRAILERDPRTGEATSLESREMWAVRVMIELSFAGFYDIATGAWIDVLSMVGLDIATPGVQARVARWLGGAADSLLDSIDLSRNIDVPEDLWWALDAAEELSDSLWVVSWALAADELHAAVLDVSARAESAGGDGDGDIAKVLSMICATARTAFAYVPDSEGEDGGDGLTEEGWWSRAAMLASELAGAGPAAAAGLAAELALRLGAMRDFYWGEIEHFASHAREVELGLSGGGR